MGNYTKQDRIRLIKEDAEPGLDPFTIYPLRPQRVRVAPFDISISYPSKAAAQHEIDFKYDTALQTADNRMTFNYVIIKRWRNIFTDSSDFAGFV